MKEKILKLLNTNNLDDALIAINLAYTLPEPDFRNLFYNLRLNAKYEGSMYFIREGRLYHFGYEIIYYVERNDIYDSSKYKDITPYETDNR